MTREEHMQWCKERALEYIDRGDAKNALASMLSDLRKHPETENHAGSDLAGMLLLTGRLQTTQELRKFIEGFN